MHKIITRIVCAGMMLLNLYPLAGFEIDQNWKIRLGEEAGKQERFAASELQKYIEQVSGHKLPIAGQGTPAIELKRNENLQREEWRVHYDPNTGIIIEGGFPRGFIYGVYEFI